MASIKSIIGSFVRTQECRDKCGDDGKSRVFVYNFAETKARRACGCFLEKCHRYYKPELPCISLNYFFVDLLPWAVTCKDCVQRYNIPGRVVMEFKETCVPFDEDLPSDLCPTTVFQECRQPGEGLQDFDRYRDASNHMCWTCSICTNPLYTIIYDCSSCNTLFDVCMDEDHYIDNVSNDDDVDLKLLDDLDKLDELRRLDCITPVSVSLHYSNSNYFPVTDLDELYNPNKRRRIDFTKSHTMNFHISDSELEQILDDYYDERCVTPDTDIIDTEPTDEYMKYNGYF